MRRAQEPEEQLPVSTHLQSHLCTLTQDMATHSLLSHVVLAGTSKAHTSAGREVRAAAKSAHD